MAGAPAATWMDLVVGVDLHVVLVPTPAGPVPTPVPHPFMALAGDPTSAAVDATMSTMVSLVSGRGTPSRPGPVLVNGHRKLTTTDVCSNKTLLPHTPLAPGQFAKTPSGEGTHRLGSLTLFGSGASCVRAGDAVETCADPIPLPTSVVVNIPKGPPVLVGGPAGISAGSSIGALTSRVVRTTFNAVSRLARFAGRLTPARLRNIAPKSLCTLTGHPVDVATGRVLTDAIDFELPGPIGLRFERSYSSGWASRSTDLGSGWIHSLDRAIWFEPHGVVCRLADGREVVFEAEIHTGEAPVIASQVFDPITGYTLRQLDGGAWQLVTPDGLIETYERRADEIDPVAMRTHLARCTVIRTRDRQHVVRFEWKEGRLAAAVDSGGRRVVFEHDDRRLLSRILLPDPHEPGTLKTHARFVYSDDAMLIEARDALGHATRYAYKGRLMVEERRRNGVRFYWGYDGITASARCVRTWGFGADGGAPIFNQRLLYDPANRKTWRFDSDGNRTEFVADELGLVIQVRDAGGGVITRTYQEMRLFEEVDAAGDSYRWIYDERGRLTGTRDGSGAKTVIKYHDRFPELVRHYRDERGAVWKHRYDRHGRRIETIGPLGTGARFEWREGLLAARVARNDARTELAYDSDKNCVELRSAAGTVTRRRFDRRGRLLGESVASANGAQVLAALELQRDLLGRVILARAADGNIERLAYDEEGNVCRVEDRHRLVSLSYTGLDWLASREEGGDRVTFAYHAEGELKELCNELGYRYRFTLDRCRRVAEEIGFDGLTRTTFKRDPSGKTIESTLLSRRGAVLSKTAVSHDPLTRRIKRTRTDGSVESLMFDAAGAIVEASNAAASVTFERDVLGRVVRERCGEVWIDTLYQPGGQIAGMDSSLGARMRIVTDPTRSRDKMLLGPISARAQMEMTRFRDGLGQEVERVLPGGIAARWRWDDAGKPIERRVEGHLGQGWSQTYAWEPGDRLAALTDTRFGHARFSRDARSRVRAEHAGERNVCRAFDPAGNVYRTENRDDRLYLPGGRLRRLNETEISYDLLGNMISRRGSGGGGYDYAWNAAGQLVEATPADGRPAVRFAYDALGRRVSKTTEHSEVRYVWSGNDLIHEVVTRTKGTISSEPCEERSVTTWFYEPDGMVPLAKFQDEARYSVVTDHLGTPTALYDDKGRLAWEIQLDLFGSPRASRDQEVAGTDCPLRWPGQYADSETGLYYNRHRYYSPELGLYIQADPIGIEGGIEPYAYVTDPLVWIDPLGLSPCPPPLLTRRQAWGQAKDRSAVPRSQQAEHGWTIHDPARLKGPGLRNASPRHQGRVHEFQIQTREGARFVYVVDHPYDAVHGGGGHMHTAVPQRGAPRLDPGDSYAEVGVPMPYK